MAYNHILSRSIALIPSPLLACTHWLCGQITNGFLTIYFKCLLIYVLLIILLSKLSIFSLMIWQNREADERFHGLIGWLATSGYLPTPFVSIGPSHMAVSWNATTSIASSVLGGCDPEPGGSGAGLLGDKIPAKAHVIAPISVVPKRAEHTFPRS
jgi:hypothetical protein